MRLPSKRADDIAKVIFDFSARLGDLADGARITEILGLAVEPVGLEMHDPSIDQRTQQAVVVTVRKGTAGIRYALSCRAAIQHGMLGYVLEIEHSMLVLPGATMRILTVNADIVAG